MNTVETFLQEPGLNSGEILVHFTSASKFQALSRGFLVEVNTNNNLHFFASITRAAICILTTFLQCKVVLEFATISRIDSSLLKDPGIGRSASKERARKTITHD